MTNDLSLIRKNILSYLQEGRGFNLNNPDVRFIPGNLPTVHFFGNCLQRAASAGQFCRPFLNTLYNSIFDMAFLESGIINPAGFFSRLVVNNAKWLYQIGSRSLLWSRLPSDLRNEITVFCKNASASRQLAICALLLGEFEMFLQYRGCSTIAAGKPLVEGNKIIMGRNLDFDSFGLADSLHLLQINHPKENDEIPSAWLSWLGFWGAFTGWNKEGLALGCMVVYNAKNDDKPKLLSLSGFTPMAWAYAHILRKCCTVEEGIQMLRKIKPLAPNNIMMVDRNGSAVVVEWSPNRLAVRPIENGILVGTNGFRSKEMFASNDDCYRYESALSHLERYPNRSMSGLEMREVLNMVNQGELTLHSAIFEPVLGRVHIAINPPPSTKGTWHELPWNVWG